MSTPQPFMTPTNNTTGNALYTAGVQGRQTVIDMSQVLSAILKNDQATLGKIGGPVGKKAHNIQIEWLEDELNPIVFSGAYTYADDLADNLVVSDPATAAALKRIVRAGTIIQPTGTNFLYRVDDQSITTTTITISKYANKGKGSSFTGVWEVVANPAVHGADATDDISRARDEKKNFLQVFERAVAIDETRIHIDMHAVPDEVKLQVARRMMELHNEMNIAVIRSYASTAGTTGVQTNQPTMKGIRQQIEDYGNTDTYKDASSGQLTETIINNLVEKMWDLGGLGVGAKPILICNSFQRRKISAFNEDIIRTRRQDGQAGSLITEVQGDIGPVLEVVLDRHMPKDSIIIADAGRMGLRHLKNDQLQMKPLAITGRRRSWQISGSYSLEVRNAGQAHGWVYSLTTS